jgi:sterol desaturase/sphingolipid hydroxylase (fatty acid hydroxylase superfamily)
MKKHQLTPTLPLKETLLISILNMLIVMPSTVFIWYQIFGEYKPEYEIRDFIMIFMALLSGALIFGIMHYILHKDITLYTNIHYIHHRATITKPFDALYQHPIEYILSAILPFLFSFWLFNISTYVINISLIFVIQRTIKGHVSIQEETSNQ